MNLNMNKAKRLKSTTPINFSAKLKFHYTMSLKFKLLQKKAKLTIHLIIRSLDKLYLNIIINFVEHEKIVLFCSLSLQA